MATIANLAVEIWAKTKRLKSGLAKALTQVGKFTKKVAKSMAKVAGIMTGVMVAAAAAIVVAVNRISAALDTVGKTADSIGITTAKLQELHFGAQLAGMSTQDLDNSMRQLSRTIGTALKGGAGATQALKDLGVSLGQLDGKDAAQQLQIVLEAAKKVTDQNKRSSALNQLFGKQHLAIQNLMRSDFSKTGKLFEKIGGGITQKQKDQIAAFEDTKLTLNTMFDNFLAQVTAEIAPAFGDLVKWTLDWVEKAGGMKKVAGDVAKGIADSFKWVYDKIIRINNAFDDMAMKAKAAKEASEYTILKLFKAPAAAVKGGVAGLNQLGRNAGIVGSAALAGKTPSEALLGTKSVSGASSAAFGDYLDRTKSGGQDKVVITVKAEEGVIVDKVTSSDRFKVIMREIEDEARRNVARQVAR